VIAEAINVSLTIPMKSAAWNVFMSEENVAVAMKSRLDRHGMAFHLMFA